MPNTLKKYRLLKELPFADSGTIFIQNKEDKIMKQSSYNITTFHLLSNVEQSLIKTYLNREIWFEPIESEEVKSIRNATPKYRNGAEVNAPYNEFECWYISWSNSMVTPTAVHRMLWQGTICDLNKLYQHNIFDTYTLASVALDNQEVYNRIYKRILEIDAGVGWVCDWSDEKQTKYFVFFNTNIYDNQKKHSRSTFALQEQGTIYMSEQAKDYMMSDEVSDEEFKVFVNR